MAERRLERLKGSGRHGTPAEREAAEREEVVLRRIHEGLEAGTPIRDLGLDADEEKAIRGFRFLTQKPVLVLLNVGEGDLADGAGARRAGRGRLRPPARDGRCAVGQDRDGARRARARRGRGLHGGARHRRVRASDRVIALSYRLLGLISFLTAGPDEVRAWPIPDGSTAVDAAGAIHTDLAKGFIRAETVAYEDLLDARLDGRGAQGRPAALGGQDLPGHDGDVLEILFSKLSGQFEAAAVRVELGEDRL